MLASQNPFFHCLSIQRSYWVILIMAFGILLSPAQGNNKTDWGLRNLGGETYVTLKAIQKFYQLGSQLRSGNKISLKNQKLHLDLKVGGNECLMNQVKFIFSHSIHSLGGEVYVSKTDLLKCIDPVLRPSFIKNSESFRTVILDPGHGGKDAGAKNGYGTEAYYNLKLAQQIRSLLLAKGLRVKMTRESDRYLSLEERVNFANSIQENAIFISLHFNSAKSEAYGIETFALSPPGISHYGTNYKASDDLFKAGNEHDSANIALATALHGSVLRRLGKNTFDRGIKRARFNVLSGVRHPAILFEGGFMSHSEEAQRIASPTYQNAIALGIVESIFRYQYAVGKKKK